MAQQNGDSGGDDGGGGEEETFSVKRPNLIHVSVAPQQQILTENLILTALSAAGAMEWISIPQLRELIAGYAAPFVSTKSILPLSLSVPMFHLEFALDSEWMILQRTIPILQNLDFNRCVFLYCSALSIVCPATANSFPAS